jgi:hypothetical protein
MWTSKRERFERLARRVGAQTKIVEGRIIDVVTQEKEECVEVHFPCEGDQELVMTLNEHTSDALLMKAENSNALELDKQIVAEIAAAYEKKAVFK